MDSQSAQIASAPQLPTTRMAQSIFLPIFELYEMGEVGVTFGSTPYKVRVPESSQSTSTQTEQTCSLDK